jgi:hypothetical protein
VNVMSAFVNFRDLTNSRDFRHWILSIYILIVAALLTLLAFELFKFASAQDIWMDETTQLSGITLKPWQLLRWLSGVDRERFGLPGDRMPPLSYLLDWAWLRFAGSSEIGFRLFHSAFVIAGAGILTAVTLRNVGPLAAILTLTFLVLSPKLIGVGVEIRAYPIFFSVTCIQVAIFLHLAARRNRADIRLLGLFSLTCLILIYTHFYGVVSTAAFFLALVVIYINSASSLAVLLVTFAGVSLGSSGVLPFVFSAVDYSSAKSVSAEPTIVQPIHKYVEFFPTLLGGPANMVSVPAGVLFLGGTLALLAVAFAAALWRLWHRKVQPCDWLFLVVIFGAILPMLASAIIGSRVNYLNANYSIWLLAPLALLVGLGAAQLTGMRLWDHLGRFVAGGAMVMGAASSTFIFLDHSSLFVHGPHRFVASLYDRAAGSKGIVYKTGAKWKFSYFPLVFSHNGDIHQYRSDNDGRDLIEIRTGSTARQAAAQDLNSAVSPYSNLLLVDVQLRHYDDIRRCQLRDVLCPQFPNDGIEEMLIETGEWREIGVERNFGEYDTQVEVFERK